MLSAIDKAGYKAGERVMLALDCAATEFFKDGATSMRQGQDRSRSEQAKYLADLVSRYPIGSIEDGMSEDDWDGWKNLTDRVGKKCQLVGDDLFVTNIKFLAKGIKNGLANSILIKVNQIGTLTETLDAVELATSRLHRRDVAPLRRDRRLDDRRPRRRHQLRPDQDRLALALRSHGEVQPAAAHRGATRRTGEVCRQGRAEGAGVTLRRIQI